MKMNRKGMKRWNDWMPLKEALVRLSPSPGDELADAFIKEASEKLDPETLVEMAHSHGNYGVGDFVEIRSARNGRRVVASWGSFCSDHPYGSKERFCIKA